MGKRLKKAIYIDALALVPKKKSGVGQTIEQTLGALVGLPEIKNGDWQIYLLAPLGKVQSLKVYVNKNIRIKSIPLHARLIDGLNRLHLLPPIDIFLGSGIYIFPNYRNLPLWRSRSLTYVYDVVFFRFPNMVEPKNQKYLSKYIRTWVERADRVITITNQVKDELEKYLNLSHTLTDVVYCGVDTHLFRERKAGEVNRVKKVYDIPYDEYFLYVGNIEPRKGIDTLIDAYIALPYSTRNTIGLVVVGGDGWLNEQIIIRIEREVARGEKILRVKRYVDNEHLPALYSGARILIHPALYEGFGMTPLEALACGTSVIATDLPAIREVLGQSLVRYFEAGDAHDLRANILEEISSATKSQLELGERTRVIARYNWGCSATTLFGIIESQYSQGPVDKPILRRIKRLYKHTDINLRRLLGERQLSRYIPRDTRNTEDLRKVIYDDYLKEQPNLIQGILLKQYLSGRRRARSLLKNLMLQFKRK